MKKQRKITPEQFAEVLDLMNKFVLGSMVQARASAKKQKNTKKGP